MVTDPDAHPRVLFSASEEYFAQAEHDLLAAFPGAVIERLGPDLGALARRSNAATDTVDQTPTGNGSTDPPAPTDPPAHRGLPAHRGVPAHTGGSGHADPSIEQVAEACRAHAPAFVRHLANEQLRYCPTRADPRTVAAMSLELVRRWLPSAAEVAVQPWVSGTSPTSYGSRELADHSRSALQDAGYHVRRAGAAYVLALCLHRKGVSVGLSPAAATLRDWPGGRVRLAKSAQQVSRSEFKLEELFATMPKELPESGRAVDLGASPGGWSRILRARGFNVWAIDPGNLHARVANDPGVHHERTTAGRFLRETRMTFDLAVNDMRMEPLRSVETMQAVRPRLRAGAVAVVTLKLGTRSPDAMADRALDLLAHDYEVRYAGQLHHNRQEVTIVARVPTALS